MYNVSASSYNIYESNQYNGRIIYTGSVDFMRTGAGHFLEIKNPSFPIDVYGQLNGGSTQRNKFNEIASDPKSLIRYFGEIAPKNLK